MHSSTFNNKDERIPSVCPMFGTMLENDLCCDNKKYDNAFGNVSGEWLLSEAHEIALANVRQTLYIFIIYTLVSLKVETNF